jgi:hypothetical protein
MTPTNSASKEILQNLPLPDSPIAFLGFVVALVQDLPGSALHHPAQPVIALTSCSHALLLKAEKNHNPAPVRKLRKGETRIVN